MPSGIYNFQLYLSKEI